MLNILEESSVIRLLLEIMGAVSIFGRYRPDSYYALGETINHMKSLKLKSYPG